MNKEYRLKLLKHKLRQLSIIITDIELRQMYVISRGHGFVKDINIRNVDHSIYELFHELCSFEGFNIEDALDEYHRLISIMNNKIEIIEKHHNNKYKQRSRHIDTKEDILYCYWENAPEIDQEK